MNNDCNSKVIDHGAAMCVINVEKLAAQNTKFRKTVWTGEHLQMTVMCIPKCGEIGVEMHRKTDQVIRIECGTATVMMGHSKDKFCFKQCASKGDCIFIPAGTWHNVVNTGNDCLKVSSIYAPPNHMRGTVHETIADAHEY